MAHQLGSLKELHCLLVLLMEQHWDLVMGLAIPWEHLLELKTVRLLWGQVLERTMAINYEMEIVCLLGCNLALDSEQAIQLERVK
mmetsp:Transcript_97214/g.197458  ORF Transcript_97214/g.197458 Transcript_97214/m.197458 type:complete len:85 (-) Transcript_97214:206-460(-)